MALFLQDHNMTSLCLKRRSMLVDKLLKLVPSSGWSARWFLDFPLCSVLSTMPSVRPYYVSIPTVHRGASTRAKAWRGSHNIRY
ncbi:hypothetical protein G6F42_015928 [Rhizopus arrhizus]|nr:hypothetical protein G6F42_015928 [Rhizopus arrhizus]